ncbi:MAG: hypothetical protein JWQ35_707, partial [Bacteriovoracaceae bacterium]|nr:hypothetical protein [Bacteriovoracaceae bacterium]
NKFRVLQILFLQHVTPLGEGDPKVASYKISSHLHVPPPFLEAQKSPDDLLKISLVKRIRHPLTYAKILWLKSRISMVSGGRGDVISAELLPEAEDFFLKGRQFMQSGIPSDVQWDDLSDEYKQIAVNWMNVAEQKEELKEGAGDKSKPKGDWSIKFIQLGYKQEIKKRTDKKPTRSEREEIMKQSLGIRNYSIFRIGLETAVDEWREAELKGKNKFIDGAFINPDKAAVKIDLIRNRLKNTNLETAQKRTDQNLKDFALSGEDQETWKSLESKKSREGWLDYKKSAMRAFSQAAMRGRLFAKSLNSDLRPEHLAMFKNDPRYVQYALEDRLQKEKNLTQAKRDDKGTAFTSALNPDVRANFHAYPEGERIQSTYASTNIKGKSDRALVWFKTMGAIGIGAGSIATLQLGFGKIGSHPPLTDAPVYQLSTHNLNPDDPFGDPEFVNGKKKFLDMARLNGLDDDNLRLIKDFVRSTDFSRMPAEIRPEFEKLEHLQKHDPNDPLSRNFDDFSGRIWKVGAYDRNWYPSIVKTWHGIPVQLKWENKLTPEEVAWRSSILNTSVIDFRLLNTVSYQVTLDEAKADSLRTPPKIKAAAAEINLRRAQKGYSNSNPALAAPITPEKK